MTANFENGGASIDTTKDLGGGNFYPREIASMLELAEPPSLVPDAEQALSLFTRVLLAVAAVPFCGVIGYLVWSALPHWPVAVALLSGGWK